MIRAVSGRYLGESGRAYFKWQGQGGSLNGEIEAHKFAHYIKPEDVVLDFGCGGGFTLAALDCARRIGVEPNPHARGVAVGNGVELYSSLAEVPDGVADVGISNHALEHVSYPIEALREIKVKVRRGGTVVICLPMEDWRARRSYDPADINHHLHAWNPQLLGNTLMEAGFEVSPASISILTHCWPPKRLHGYFYRHLPLFAFDALCNLCARVLRRRQIVAVVFT